jgi:hypothetical protein
MLKTFWSIRLFFQCATLQHVSCSECFNVKRKCLVPFNHITYSLHLQLRKQFWTPAAIIGRHFYINAWCVIKSETVGVGMCMCNWMPKDVCQLGWSKLLHLMTVNFCGKNVHAGPHFVVCELNDSKPRLT